MASEDFGGPYYILLPRELVESLLIVLQHVGVVVNDGEWFVV